MVTSKGKLAGIHTGLTVGRCHIAVDVFDLLEWIQNVVGADTNEIV